MSGEWFAAAGHIVGNSSNWETVYEVSPDRWPTRALAISDGFETFRSDDFNVGRIQDGVLTWFGWMFTPHDVSEYADVCGQFGAKSVSGTPDEAAK